MEFILLGLRLLLATVFILAAAGKFLDLAVFRRTLAEFGVPVQLVGSLGVVVPVVELITAVLLVPAAWAPRGAMLGLLLLATFTVAVATNLARGRTPDCRCFGQLSATPIGVVTICRTVGIAVCAVPLVSKGGGPDLLSAIILWIEAPPDQQVSLLVALLGVPGFAALAWLAGELYERNCQLSRRVVDLEKTVAEFSTRSSDGAAIGLPVGSFAPSFNLPLMAGDRASLDTVTAAKMPVLLIFSSAHCPACAELWPDIGRWQRDHVRTLKVMVVGTGSATALEMKLMGTGVSEVLLAEGSKLADTYRVGGIPSAVVVGPDGRIESDTVMGQAAIRALVQTHADTRRR
jgi:uncharacterized membrane protein YphA (DoxX/SURF4 family)